MTLTALTIVLLSLLFVWSFPLFWCFKINIKNFTLPKHSKWQGIITTDNKLLKFQCLDNGFLVQKFKSNWLNNDKYDILHLMRKVIDVLAKEIINFYYHSKYRVTFQNLHNDKLLLSQRITQNSYLLPVIVQLLTLWTLYNYWCFLMTFSYYSQNLI